MPLAAFAQMDEFGMLDTIYAEINKIDDLNYSITVIYANDENVEGLSIPLQYSATDNRLVTDSVIFKGGRAEEFVVKRFRPDTSIQCVTLGLIANLGPTTRMIKPGKGRLATIFLSSMDNKPIEGFTLDTTTTYPNNSLLIVASRLQGPGLTDTVPPVEHERKNIIPAFVVIEPKK